MQKEEEMMDGWCMDSVETASPWIGVYLDVTIRRFDSKDRPYLVLC